MTLLFKINPFTNKNKNINIIKNIFRYSHHYSENYLYNINIQNIYRKSIYEPKNVIINLLGETDSVNKSSWEIKSFASDKSLYTYNMIYDIGTLSYLLLRNNYLQFIVNRCYNMSCDELITLNSHINYVSDWKQYNLYVMPDATNRFTTHKFIIYPLAASEESKRKIINILID